MSSYGSKVGQSWVSFVYTNGTPEFAAGLTEDASLEATVLDAPLFGADAIGGYFKATTGMFDHIDFVRELSDEEVTLLEWGGSAFGQKVGGLTFLLRDAAGLLRSIRIYQHPLPVVKLFSEELRRRLDAQAQR